MGLGTFLVTFYSPRCLVCVKTYTSGEGENTCQSLEHPVRRVSLLGCIMGYTIVNRCNAELADNPRRASCKDGGNQQQQSADAMAFFTFLPSALPGRLACSGSVRTLALGAQSDHLALLRLVHL